MTLENTMTSDQVARQIQIGRKFGSSGFILFNLNDALLTSVLPDLHHSPRIGEPQRGGPIPAQAKSLVFINNTARAL